MAYDPENKFDTTVHTVETEVKNHTGIVAAIAVVVLAFAGYIYYAHSTGQPILSKATVENGYDSTKAAVTPDAPASAASQ